MTNNSTWTIENYKKLATKLAQYPNAIKGGVENVPQEAVLAHLYYELLERCNNISTNIALIIKNNNLTTDQVKDIVFDIDMELDFLLNNIISSGRYDTLIKKYVDDESLT